MENKSRLTDFRYDLRHCFKLFDISDKQIAVAQNIHRSFGIPEQNIIRLIAFTGYIISSTGKNSNNFNYSFIREVTEFLNDAGNIKTVSFSTESKSLTVKNTKLAGSLLESLVDLINSKSITSGTTSASLSNNENIKQLAGELYEDLVTNEKLTPWRALCVIGYIYLLFDLKLDDEEQLLAEHEFQQRNKNSGSNSKTYLNYLTDRIKNYLSD